MPRFRTNRLSRAALLRGTALQAAFALSLVPAHAQPAPNARPQGGQVVGGSATIARAPGSTIINQSSDRAAIDWRSFDVGRNQAVTFQQPSATSATLNRVTGPDPSAIAGRISANGQVILTNPNGVTFFKGAQVNAQSLIVSAPGITNQNFMAGKIVFDQAPKPGARIDNAGTITVKQAGLAALVAPSVANSGTINARLGTVILAGAAAHTLDMYGDGLVSIDVTKQVRQAPGGPGIALVTNTGTIRADGGTIQLTARAADGVVQTLVDAGGTLRANTVGAKTGRIEIAGTGGGVVIAGRIATDSRTGQAGTIVLNGSAATTVTDTAHVTANGGTGGGTIAVGTTLARARTTGPAPAATSARTTIAPGARLAANATTRGDGGRVTILSTASTDMAGSVSAKGGRLSGNGGTIELSGEAGFRLTGRSTTAAPHGTAGTVVIDPRDLLITDTPPTGTPNQPPSGTDPTIAASDGGTATDAYVTPRQLENQSGTIHVLTTRDLTVDIALSNEGGGIILEAGRTLSVTANGSVAAGGNLSLIAASSAIPGFDPAGILSIAGSISGQSIILSSGTGGIALAANVTAGTALSIGTPGALTQTAGIVTTPQLYGTAGSVSLPGANAIDGVGNGQNASFQTTSGGFSLTNQPGQTLTIGNAAGGGGLFVAAGQPVGLQVDGLVLDATTGGKAITAPGSTLLLQPVTSDRTILLSATASGTETGSEGGSETGPQNSLVLALDSLSRLSIGTLQLGNRPATSGPIVLGQSGEAVDLTAAGIGKLVLSTSGDISQGGPLTVADLAVFTTGATDLSNTANRIDTLSALGTNSPTAITTAGNLALTGTTGTDSATILAGGSITQSATGSLTASDSLTLHAGDSSIPGADPAATLTLAGRVRPANTLDLSAGTGGIALTGSVFATTITIDTTGPLIQGTSGISATALTGSAQSVNLPSTQNAIQGVSFYTTGSAGDFTLVTSGPLIVQAPSSPNRGGIDVQSGRAINLTADSLSFLSGRSGQTALNAPNGLVGIQPFTAGTPIVLTTSAKPVNTLGLTTAELGQINTSTLILGGTNPGTGQRNTGPITLGQPGEAIDLTSFGTLGLSTTGAVTQGGPLAVGSLSANVGSLTLITAGNQIGTAAGISATGDIALHTDGDLSVGFTQAGGTLRLSSGGSGGMTLFGDLRAQTVDLNSLNTNATIPMSTDPGIVQTAGSITTGTLTGAAGSARLGSVNAVATLGDFATYGGMQLNDGASPLSIAGTVSATTGAISLTAAGLTQTAGSRLLTPELDGASSAATILTARGNAVGSIGSFDQTAGDFALTTSVATLGLGRIAATAGSLTFVADGIGSAATASAISAPAGSITFTPYTTGRRIELVGTGTANPGTLSIGAGVTSGLSAQRLVLDTTGTIGIGNAGDTIDLRTAVTTLQLQAGGAVTQGGSTSLRVATLTGSADSLTLSSATNAIDAIDGFSATAAVNLRTGGALSTGTVTSAGALTLTAGGDLTAQGPITAAGTATLTATGTVTTSSDVRATDIAINAANITQSAGTLAATNSVSLASPGGAIAQTGGTIAAASLTASAATLSLTNANTIASASIAATGSVTLSDTGALTLTSLTAGTAGIRTSGSLALGGTIVTTDLTLAAAGPITQPGGTLTTGTLSLTATDRIVLDRANTIGTLTTAASTGGLTLVDTGALTVTGPLRDPVAMSLRTGGDLSLAGTLSTGTLSLTAGGAITQPGGTLTADTLSIASAGSTTLGQLNVIATLASASSTGGLTVADAGNLAVSGPLTDSTAITLRTGGTLTLSGPITTGTLTLAAGGAITQPGGTISAANLAGTAGSAAFGQANAISTLTGFTTNGGFSLIDAGALTVTGPLRDPVAMSLRTGGDLSLAGTLSTGTLSLTAGGAIAQPGGILTADTLSIASSGSTTLGQLNAIATLTSATSTGGLTVTDVGNLVVGGLLTDSTAITLRTGGALTLSGPITTGTLTVAAGGAITQPGGTISATNLGGTAGSAAFGRANAISTLTGFTTNGGFSLVDASPLTVAGIVTAGSAARPGQTIALTTADLTFAPGGRLVAPGGTVSLAEYTAGQGITLGGSGIPFSADTLVIGSATAGPIDITGAFDLTGLTLDLRSAAAIRESGAGAIKAAALTGVGGSASLTGRNQIGTLAGFATAGDFTLANAADLVVAGPVTAANVTLSSTGALTLAGTVATPGILTLTAVGSVTQPGGMLTAATLRGSAASAQLTQSNAIGALAGFTAGQSFVLVDTGPLAITGPVGVGTGGSITLNTPALTFGPGGSLAAPGGSVGLAGFGTGGISLGDVAVAAGTLSIGTATGGPVTITGALDVSAGTLDLHSAGSITETGAGAIAAATLTGRAGSATLNGANRIGTLGSFTAGGALSLATSTDLGIVGPVTAGSIAVSSAGNLVLSGPLGTIAATTPNSRAGSSTPVGDSGLADTTGAITLSSGGNLVLSSTLATQGSLTLTAAGDITQPGGSIAANSLGGSAANATFGQAANSVGTLSDFLTTGDFSYAGSGNLTLGGTVAGRTVTLGLGGRIDETAPGRLIAGRLSGSADSAALIGANQIDTLAFTTVNGFALTDTRPLTVIGPLTDRSAGLALTAPSIVLAGPLTAPSLTLASPGAVSQSAGPLLVGTLAGRVGRLDIGTQAQASIGTLGALTATDTVTLTDQTPLRVAGPLTAPNFTVTATGSLILDGGTIRTDGQPLATQLGASPAQPGSTLAVRPDSTGSASLIQLGTTTLTSLSGGTATLRLGLPAGGGTLALNDLQAPGNDVVLALGSGSARGTLRVGRLAILGSGGSADLTGQIGARSDSTAAQDAQLLPGTNLRYTFNNCAIAAISCSSDTFGSVALPTAAIVSILRPDILTLGILDLTVTRDRDDPTLLLPNISDRDY